MPGLGQYLAARPLALPAEKHFRSSILRRSRVEDRTRARGKRIRETPGGDPRARNQTDSENIGNSKKGTRSPMGWSAAFSQKTWGGYKSYVYGVFQAGSWTLWSWSHWMSRIRCPTCRRLAESKRNPR